MARRRSFTSQLYRVARLSNTIDAMTLGRVGAWRRLWK